MTSPVTALLVRRERWRRRAPMPAPRSILAGEQAAEPRAARCKGHATVTDETSPRRGTSKQGQARLEAYRGARVAAFYAGLQDLRRCAVTARGERAQE